MSNKLKLKKIFSITGNVLMALFIAVALFLVMLLVFGQKDKDGTTQMFGYQFRVITSDSMGKCKETDVSDFEIKSIPIKSMVFIDLVPEDEEKAKKWFENEVHVGDVLTFRYVYTTQVTITHRVEQKILNSDGSYTLHLVGDNKNSDDGILKQVINTGDLNSPNYVIGKVVGQSKLLGNLVTTLRNPIGMILIIILPSLGIIIFEIVRIINVLNANKKKRIKEEQEKKESEIELLKQKLAELEKKQNEQLNNDNNSEKVEDNKNNCLNDETIVGDSNVIDEDILESEKEDAEDNKEEIVVESKEKVAEDIKEEVVVESKEEVAEDIKEEVVVQKEDAYSQDNEYKQLVLSWKNDIEKRKQEGLTVDEWCKANKISKTAYYQRLKEVKKEFGE